MIRKLFLTALFLLFTLQIYSQETSNRQREEFLYWESVLDAYEDFANEREQLRGKRKAAEKLREKQLRIEGLLLNPKGKMTEEQQLRFNSISLRSGLPLIAPVTQETSPAKPTPANKAQPTAPSVSKRTSKPVIEEAGDVDIPYRERPVKGIERDRTECNALLPAIHATDTLIPPVPISVPKVRRQWHYYMLFQTGFSPQWQIGLIAGTTHPSGWGIYASWRMHPAMSNLGNPYVVENADKIWTNGKTAVKEMSANIGLLVKTGPVAIYLGGGYGYKTVFWQDSNSQWGKILPASVTGMSVETGAMLPLGKFCLNLGVGTLAFKTFCVTAGVGIAL